MATGTPGTNGVWQYGEDDSEATFSALLNKAASTTDTQIGLDRARLTTLELPGRVLQVVTATLSSTFSTTTTIGTPVDITGLSVTITPKYSNSKILLTAHIGAAKSGSGNMKVGFLFRTGTTAIGVGAAAGSRQRVTGFVSHGTPDPGVQMVKNISMAAEHSPGSTSAITYKVSINSMDGQTMYINRDQGDTDATTYGRAISTITATEIKV